MDLAARNVLVGNDLRCQIADFGLTHAMTKGTKVFRLEERIPLAMKWMSPEALENMLFSEVRCSFLVRMLQLSRMLFGCACGLESRPCV
jgi:hypothetical protein